MTGIRVMHYMNQFFAGIGAEEKADAPVGSYEGPGGPGKRLQDLLKDSAEIVVTAYCGDDYFPNHQDEVLEKILKIAKDHNVEMVVAGPAFASGRHGFACIEVCHSVSTSLDLDCVTGVSVDNPALAGYKQYKDRRVFAFPTRGDVSGMEDALSSMARCVLKLAAGSEMGPASEEGYIPRGIRVSTMAEKSGAERAIDMLLNKVAGRSLTTEIPIERLEKVPVAPRIINLQDAQIALACTAGVVPQGNPDGFTSGFGKIRKWKKYPIDRLKSMQDATWEVLQGGMFCGFMTENPNYGVPLDMCREMEKEGVFARVYPSFYSTSGNVAAVSAMQAAGREMVLDMKAEGVEGVILVST